MNNYLHIIFAFTILLIMLGGCSDDSTVNTGEPPTIIPQNFSVTINGELWNAESVTAFTDFEAGSQVVNILGNVSSETNGEDPKPSESFIISIFIPSTESITPGDYSGNSVLLSWNLDFPGQSDSKTWESETAEVLVLESETEFITGTFHGTLIRADENEDDLLEEITVTDGEFSARFQ